MQDVKWTFIDKLQQLQEKEGLRAANKLRKAHIEYWRQVMKVRLAAQTFSSSVSKSLELGRQLQVKELEGSEGTSKFITEVDEYVPHLCHACLLVLHWSVPYYHGLNYYMKTSSTSHKLI